jgi:hypothetical protein
MFRSLITPLVFAGILAAGSAQAAGISYYLTDSNKLADGTNYLLVSIDPIGDDVHFTVQALQPLLDIAGHKFGIDQFAFNVTGGTMAEASDVDDLPRGWRARNDGRMDGFGRFDIRVLGGKRQDTLEFSITGVSFDDVMNYVDLSTGRAPEGVSFFAARVSGFKFRRCGKGMSDVRLSSSSYGGWGDDGGGGHGHSDSDSDSDGGGHGHCGRTITSAYFGNAQVVPAPAAGWLLATGLGALAWRRKRRNRAAAND